MARHLHYGKQRVDERTLFNVGRCPVCGTCNPSEPGKGLYETCAGCGTPRKTEDRKVVMSRLKFRSGSMRKNPSNGGG